MTSLPVTMFDVNPSEPNIKGCERAELIMNDVNSSEPDVTVCELIQLN